MFRLVAALISLRWLAHLGAPGLIVVGIVDQSFVPIPGGIDFLTVLLVARNQRLWLLYWALATAGALQYPTRKFLLALASGRMLRYGIVVWLAHTYGRHIIRVFRQNSALIVGSFIAFSVTAALGGWLWTRWQRTRERRQPQARAA